MPSSSESLSGRNTLVFDAFSSILQLESPIPEIRDEIVIGAAFKIEGRRCFGASHTAEFIRW